MPGAAAFTRHLYIDRTPEEVFRFLAEPANAPQWMGGLWEARLEGGRPLDEGSRIRGRRRFLLLTDSFELEVTACNPTRDYALSGRGAGAEFSYRYFIEPETEEGSRVTMRAEVVTRSPPASLVGPLAPLLLRRLDWGQLDRLKRVLDG